MSKTQEPSTPSKPSLSSGVSGVSGASGASGAPPSTSSSSQSHSSSSSAAPASAPSAGGELWRFSQGLADAVAHAGSSVVQVDARPRMAASGVVWSADGVIVAADHTLERERDIVVGLPGGERVAATLLGRDPGTDLAALRVAAGALVPAVWADAESARVGHLALAVGRTWGEVRAHLTLLSDLRPGWNNAFGRRIERYLQADCGIFRGFSGSLLVDVAGRALGLNTSGLLRGRALAVPGETIRRVVAALLEHGSVQRGHLGVGLAPARLPDGAGGEARVGLVVLGVEAGGPAEKAGVLIGDVLTALDGQPASGLAGLHALLYERRAGDEVLLALLRGGEPRELRIMLAAAAR